MKPAVFVIALLALIFSAYRQRTASHSFEQLFALEGNWVMKNGNRVIGEEWLKVSNDRMDNRGYFVRNSDTIITERVTLTNTPEGIFYTSTVTDQNNSKPVSFRLTMSEGRRFVFENALHDFPKRIIYEFKDDDHLFAQI